MQSGKNPRLTSRNEVIRAVRDWWEAWFSGNLNVLVELTCDRYMAFAADNTIIISGKPALAEQARKTVGLTRVFEWAIMKPEIKRLEDAAVCNYHFHVAGALGRTRVNLEGLVTDVLVRVGEVWKLVAHHGIFPTVQARSSHRNNPLLVFWDAPVLDESLSPPGPPIPCRRSVAPPRRSHTDPTQEPAAFELGEHRDTEVHTTG